MLIWFAETTLVATVLAAIAALAGRCLRLGPVARHVLWLVVLVRLVAPPVLSWPWSVRLAWHSHETAVAASGALLQAGELRRPALDAPEEEAPMQRVAARPPLQRAALPDLVLPMNSRALSPVLVDLARFYCGSGTRRRAKIPPTPTWRTDAWGVACSALCVARGLSRGGDCLDRLSYRAGKGVSSKPIAAAFRWRTFNILAFSLASYSSIDCVTYSWPYLSIL
jgi:hypothetical protein